MQPPSRHLRVVLEPAERDEPTVHADVQVTHSSLPVEVVNPAQPFHGSRGDAPGPRGCWALKRDGSPCGAARRADGDYCNAHSGLGVAKNPAEWAPLAQKASAENRRRRAALRLELGITRPQSIRGMLRAQAWVERERVAAAALAGLDADSPAQRSRAALAIIDAVEPQQRATLDVPLPSSPDGLDGMSLSELRQLAERVS